MDQIKIGAFLKVLRKEKNLTQEQLAEQLGVSGRTVSRWETGNNMPDISLLVEIAEFYEVTIPELINGERKSETMNENEKEVATTMADYATEEKSEILKSIRNQSFFGVCAIAVLLRTVLSRGNFQHIHHDVPPRKFVCYLLAASASFSTPSP